MSPVLRFLSSWAAARGPHPPFLLFALWVSSAHLPPWLSTPGTCPVWVYVFGSDSRRTTSRLKLRADPFWCPGGRSPVGQLSEGWRLLGRDVGKSCPRTRISSDQRSSNPRGTPSLCSTTSTGLYPVLSLPAFHPEGELAFPSQPKAGRTGKQPEESS